MQFSAFPPLHSHVEFLNKLIPQFLKVIIIKSKVYCIGYILHGKVVFPHVVVCKATAIEYMALDWVYFKGLVKTLYGFGIAIHYGEHDSLVIN